MKQGIRDLQPGVLECEGADLVQLSQELLRGDRCMRFRAVGNSMYPAIHDQDVIWVQPCRSSRFSLGEIVFFQTSDGSVLAHRVVKIKHVEGKLQLYTKGDASGNQDRPIYADQVLGQVVMVERGGRSIPLNT